MTVLIVLGIVAVLVVAALVWWMAASNGVAASRRRVRESWVRVEAALAERRELVPAVIDAFKRRAAHESGTIETLARARTRAIRAGRSAAGTEELAADEGELSRALGHLFDVSEAYPELRSDEGFAGLRRYVAEAERRIVSACRDHDATVWEHNEKIRSTPTNLAARMSGVGPAETFEVATSLRGEENPGSGALCGAAGNDEAPADEVGPGLGSGA